jgi:hypothetical protein
MRRPSIQSLTFVSRSINCSHIPKAFASTWFGVNLLNYLEPSTMESLVARLI